MSPRAMARDSHDTDSAKLLNRALELGYTLLDTAAMYGSGHNETLIGRYLAHRRTEYVLASKCGIYADEKGENPYRWPARGIA